MTGILYPVDEIFRAISHPKHDMAQLVHGWAGLRAIPVAVTDSHPTHIRTCAKRRIVVDWEKYDQWLFCESNSPAGCAAHEAVCARPRVRTLNTANHDGWQRGERLDGRDAVQVAVQQRVAGADNADEADDGDEAFVPGTTAEADGEDSDGYWWWQSTEARAAKWVVPQWEVLAAGRVGWDGGLKKVRVNESRGNSGEQE